MRFIADMRMDVRVASWLNSQGHDATHLRDEGLQRLPNGEIFDKAKSFPVGKQLSRVERDDEF